MSPRSQARPEASQRSWYEEDKWEAVHNEDWEIAEQEIEPGPSDRDRVWIMPVGMDCARKLGLKWSRNPETARDLK
jgi:hypothetical protein